MSDFLAPKISVILLNLNAYQDTRDCLESLRQVRYDNFEITVVDNGSVDDSASRLAREFASVTFLRSERNLGFTGGNNLGIDHALQRGAKYVLLLNNDTLVDPEFLRILIEAAETDDKIGMVGPKIYYASEPRRIWYAGGRTNSWGCHHIGLDEFDTGTKFSRIEQTGFISGCAMLIKSRVLQEIGLLDDRLFVYHEDTDLCMRARKANYTCVFVPQSVIWHKISRTCGRESNFTLYLSTRNQLAWIARHAPAPYKPAVLACTFAKKLAKMALLGSRNRHSGRAVWAGIVAFVRDEYGPPRNGWMPGTTTQNLQLKSVDEPGPTTLSSV